MPTTNDWKADIRTRIILDHKMVKHNLTHVQMLLQRIQQQEANTSPKDVTQRLHIRAVEATSLWKANTNEYHRWEILLDDEDEKAEWRNMILNAYVLNDFSEDIDMEAICIILTHEIQPKDSKWFTYAMYDKYQQYPKMRIPDYVKYYYKILTQIEVIYSRF